MLDTIRSVAGLILLFSATVGLVSSLLVIVLIFRLQTWKTYHRIVLTLCAFQAVYDIAYYFLPAYEHQEVLGVYRFLATFSGIAVCMWTNLISCVNFYTIAYLQPFSLFVWHQRALISTIVISSAFAGIFLLVALVKDADNTMDYLYFYFRAVSTFVNVVMFSVLYFVFNRTECASCIDAWFSQYDFTMRDMTQDLLAVLSTKLMYYPVVQIFARVVSLWWEYRYGFTVTAFDAGEYSVRKAGAMILYAMFSPSAGLGYLGTFLYVHPRARLEVYYLCRDLYRVCCLCQSPGAQTASLRVADGLARDSLTSHPTATATFNGSSSSTVTNTNTNTNTSLMRSDSVSSTAVERDSYIQVNPIVPKGTVASTAAATTASTAATTTTTTVSYSHNNPIVTTRHHDTRQNPNQNANGDPRTQSSASDHSASRFPLHPSATGFERRVFHEHWTIAPFAYDMEEAVIWEEFFRRKLERESMTVHHDKV
eukprot:gene9934-7112_t